MNKHIAILNNGIENAILSFKKTCYLKEALIGIRRSIRPFSLIS